MWEEKTGQRDIDKNAIKDEKKSYGINESDGYSNLGEDFFDIGVELFASGMMAKTNNTQLMTKDGTDIDIKGPRDRAMKANKFVITKREAEMKPTNEEMGPGIKQVIKVNQDKLAGMGKATVDSLHSMVRCVKGDLDKKYFKFFSRRLEETPYKKMMEAADALEKAIDVAEKEMGKGQAFLKPDQMKPISAAMNTLMLATGAYANTLKGNEKKVQTAGKVQKWMKVIAAHTMQSRELLKEMNIQKTSVKEKAQVKKENLKTEEVNVLRT